MKNNGAIPVPQMTPMLSALAFIVVFRSCKTAEEKERLAECWNDDHRGKARRTKGW